ncbi:S41 family peptidase, partial [Slackia exigua]|uniref:S41 family peptidase n=1 Tax=Slackia exigua TaxID=84109 RepID=UPI0036F3BDFB
MGSLKHSKHVSDQERRDVRILKALFVLVLAFALFALGFLVRGYDPLMERLGVNSVSVPAPVASNASMQVSDVANHLSEVMSIISSDSVDSYDESSATNAVLGAFLESTGDSYARYYDADRYSAYVDSSSSDYPGVGVFFSEYNGKAYALDVFEGSSAAEAGVKPGDFMVAIDGDSSQDWSAT